MVAAPKGGHLIAAKYPLPEPANREKAGAARPRDLRIIVGHKVDDVPVDGAGSAKTLQLPIVRIGA